MRRSGLPPRDIEVLRGPPGYAQARPLPKRAGDDGGFWLLSMVDLLLLMLCSFVLLVVADEPEPPAAATPAPQVKTAPAVIPSERPAKRPGESTRTAARAARVERLEPYELIARYTAEVGRTTPRETFTTVPTPVREEARREGSVVSALEEIFRPAGEHAEIEIQSGAVTVGLRDAIMFRSGSADLLPGVLPFLDEVAALLDESPGIQIEISGHTDDQPISTGRFPSNWELSAARAASVARYLLSRRPIDPRRATIVAHAEHSPIDDRPTELGRARNRRVEIRFEQRLTDARRRRARGGGAPTPGRQAPFRLNPDPI